MSAESLNRSDISPAVAHQAVNWLLEMQEGPLDPVRQQAWQAWLSGHSEHQRAWAHIQRVHQRLGGLSPALTHATLGAAKSSGRRQTLKLLALLAAGSTLGWSLRDQQAVQSLLADYSSAVGERRTLALGDGSRLQLNTATSVDVRFDAQQRLIHLRQGEVMIDAAADARPLELLSAEGRVRLSSGASRFNLRQFAGRTQVAVLSGALQVQPQQVAAPLLLQPRQQVSFDRQEWGVVRGLDAGCGAWSDGMLVASRMRLADFLLELGRYRHGHLACDSAVADLLISGSYPLADSERILDMLEVALPVRVQRYTRYWIKVQART
ncbi:FecR family protein [Pseudomonas sp. DTU_2021_1001937_2_SI_NGA_ILE_001]|uniref:FecR family protein n=1 Tax=Pseudomonas sp. DTU_2021_1001937_2_SI_NGA_ILE_001 TaxID=3077589 RepID=UPI0028FC2E85|nr:FecR family protein [Pseudomonas sp. DTU_2021_1001937_2_SI_NGA_ILE_001]WNW13518.1 FecR family protein [Pseudomonas sp. DTU_2021_1001937_2_SI_NGA_ILE_001]